MFSQAFEEGANRLNMRYRIGIEHNDIVEVSRQLLKSLLIDHLDEPPRRSAAALRHNEPLAQARGCAERCKGDRILMRLTSRNEETKSHRENTFPEPKESRTWSTRGIGSWLSLLV